MPVYKLKIRETLTVVFLFKKNTVFERCGIKNLGLRRLPSSFLINEDDRTVRHACTRSLCKATYDAFKISQVKGRLFHVPPCSPSLEQKTCCQVLTDGQVHAWHYLGPVDSSSRFPQIAGGSLIARLSFSNRGSLFWNFSVGSFKDLRAAPFTRVGWKICVPRRPVQIVAEGATCRLHGAGKFVSAFAKATIAVTFVQRDPGLAPPPFLIWKAGPCQRTSCSLQMCAPFSAGSQREWRTIC